MIRTSLELEEKSKELEATIRERDRELASAQELVVTNQALRSTIQGKDNELEALKKKNVDAGNAKTEALQAAQEAQRAKAEAQDVEHEANQAKAEAQRLLRRSQDPTSCNPFALILIDGDGYIFQETLIQKGVEGGEKAAHHLQEHAQHYFRSKNLEGWSNWRIMVRIYLNIDGLSNRLLRSGCVSDSEKFRKFMLG